MARQLEQPDQRAADDRPQGQREAGHGGPHAQRVGPGLAVRVDVPDDGQGAGLADAAAPNPMIDPAGDQPVDVARQRRHDRAGAEDGDPDEHDALAAEDVAEHAGDQHEAGERQGVAVDHPLQRRDPGMQIALDIGQADADDRVVEEGEEEDGAQGGQRHRLGSRAEPALADLKIGGGLRSRSDPRSNGHCCHQRVPTLNFPRKNHFQGELCRVARFEIRSLMEHELTPVAPAAAGVGADQEGLMIAALEPVQDRPFDPGRALGQDGAAGWPVRPFDALEFVDPVATVLPEPRGEFSLVLTE